MNAVTDTLDALTLKSGGHSSFESGACLLEAASFIAGEPWSDHPQCVSPVLGAYGRALNDRLGDEDRQKLKKFIPDLIGTAGDGHDEARRWLAADWAIRVATPRWLDAAGLTEHAENLRSLPEITDRATADAARSVARAARDDAYAARVKSRAALRERVEAEMKKRGVKVSAAAVAAADAAAAAVAAAVAVADAAAAAVAAAVAVAAADAAAVAAAVAAADADAAAAAVAAAVADFTYPSAGWSKVYDAVYTAVKKRIAEDVDSKFAEVRRVTNEEAIELLGRMIHVGDVPEGPVAA